MNRLSLDLQCEFTKEVNNYNKKLLDCVVNNKSLPVNNINNIKEKYIKLLSEDLKQKYPSLNIRKCKSIADEKLELILKNISNEVSK